MMLNHEGSTSNSPLLDPVDLGHHHNDPAQSLPPKAAQNLKRSHWESVDKAKTCSEANCQKKFARFDRRRNCCMCGKVYCRKCTLYRRKLSPDAQPDLHFGILCHVCRICYEKDTQQDSFAHDWTDHFEYYRKRQRKRHEVLGEEYGDVPIPSTTGSLKRDRIVSELDRLCTGFEANHSFMKGLVADLLKTPSWQKSRHWVVSRSRHICQGCSETFKRLAQKVNCRVCGQVYCTRCTKEEVMLYIPNRDTSVQWCINGKEGGPEQTPRAFTLLPVCGWCCEELQAILLDKLNESRSLSASLLEPEEPEFMDTLDNLHRSLTKMKLIIESRLPKFQNYVDSMDIAEGASSSLSSKSPINDLAKATCELSDQFSQLAVESQKLRRLHPTTPSEAKLLKHVCIGTYQFYDDNMYVFRLTKKRLEDMMPIETLAAVQQAINQRSLEIVHVLLKQICLEAINVELGFKIACDSVTDPLSKCVDTLEGELEEFYKECDQDWAKHVQAVSVFIKEEMSGPKKKLKLMKEAKTPFRNVIVLRKMLQQCSNYLSTSLRELDAKTPMTAFPHSKGEIRQLAKDFEQRVGQLSSQHPQVFQNGRR